MLEVIAQLLLTLVFITPQQESPFAWYQWQNRIIVIDQKMSSFDLQLKRLLDRETDLQDRDLLVFTRRGTTLVCENAKEKPLTDATDRYTGISLIGKDGRLKLVRKNPVEAQLIFDLIDTMPMRQSEMKRKFN